jgi:FKBP-type peptidyl-prolyl cis-trans isomerase FkpA
MKQFINAAAFCAVVLTACNTSFKKAKDGSSYKVISDGKGVKAANGNFLELQSVVKYKDSVLFNSYEEGMPQYGAYDTAAFPSPFKEAFTGIRVGDSIVIKMATDSLINKNQAAPFMKKGQFLLQTYKIIGIYTTQQQVDSAQKSHVKDAQAKAYLKQKKELEKTLKEEKTTLDADIKAIEAYLAKNNIKATKTSWGTFVAVQQEGTGNPLTTTDIASLNYTGKTFDSSKVFDSNTDPKFGHVSPYDVQLGRLDGIIAGWPDAILQMKKGTKATVYIPSTLGYGKTGRAPSIKPNDILVFDMEVVNVISAEELAAKQEAQRKEMEIQQQRMMDSMQKANPNAGKPQQPK